MDQTATNSTTLFEIASVILTSGILVGIIRIIFTSGKIKQRIESMDEEIKDIKSDIKNIDARLNRLEGAFFERGYWEAKSYQIIRKTNDAPE